MNSPITGPILDDLTSQWIDGAIPVDTYLKQARRRARESARRDITKQDHRRSNGDPTANGRPESNGSSGWQATPPNED